MTEFKAGQRVFIAEPPHDLHSPEDWGAMELHLNGIVVGRYSKDVYRVKRDSGRTENINAEYLVPDNSSQYDNIFNIGIASVGVMIIVFVILAIF